jgi:hypothetical protein
MIDSSVWPVIIIVGAVFLNWFIVKTHTFGE